MTVTSVTDDRVRTAGRPWCRSGATRSSSPAPSAPAGLELWADLDGRLLRFSVPAQGFDIIRSDIASVTSRREPVARPNDERVTIPANGFSLTGTLSQPASEPGSGRPPPGGRARQRVGADRSRRDRWPASRVFGQLASALADAGFVVVRYDKRGVGQSGGRIENTTLGDYAEDAIAAVKFLDRRPDVDRRRIAVLGYGEGGAVASVAASRQASIAALVLVAAPGVTGERLMLEQQQHLLDLMNIPDADRRAKIELQKTSAAGGAHRQGPRRAARRPAAPGGHAVVPQLPRLRSREGAEEVRPADPDRPGRHGSRGRAGERRQAGRHREGP